MNLNVPLPPPYSHDVWFYNKADRKNIQSSIKTCNFARLFINLTINEKVELLSNMIINISKKKVEFKYDETPWINKSIKSALHKRSRLTKI